MYLRRGTFYKGNDIKIWKKMWTKMCKSDKSMIIELSLKEPLSQNVLSSRYLKELWRQCWSKCTRIRLINSLATHIWVLSWKCVSIWYGNKLYSEGKYAKYLWNLNMSIKSTHSSIYSNILSLRYESRIFYNLYWEWVAITPILLMYTNYSITSHNFWHIYHYILKFNKNTYIHKVAFATTWYSRF